MDNEELWGILIGAWIMVVLPSFAIGTIDSFRKFSSEEEKRREGRFTRFSFWWIAGLILLMITWGVGLDPLLSGFALLIYLIGSVVFKVIARRLPEGFSLSLYLSGADRVEDGMTGISKKVKLFVIISVIWFLMVAWYIEDEFGLYKMSDFFEAIPWFLIFNLPLVIGWGIWWIRRD